VIAPDGGGFEEHPTATGPWRALLAVAALYVQIVLGALLTHAGWLWLHVAGAVVVFAVTPMVTARARRSGDAVAAPISRVLLVLLAVQLLLGAGAYLSRFSDVWIPGEQLTMLVLPVTHRLVGGLLLATAVLLAVRVVAAVDNGPSASLPRSGRPAAYAAYASAVRSLGASHLDGSRRPTSTVSPPGGRA